MLTTDESFLTHDYGDLICKYCGKHEAQYTYTINVYIICKSCEKIRDAKTSNLEVTT